MTSRIELEPAHRRCPNMSNSAQRVPFVLLLAATVVLIHAGCSSTVPLMPTPNIYANGYRDPFPDVAPEFQNNKVDVLYLTDRKPEGGTAEHPTYGYERSRSLAFGVAEVRFGKDITWDQLVQDAHTSKRTLKLDRHLAQTTELVRFPPTPRTLLVIPEGSGGIEGAAHDAATRSSAPPTTSPSGGQAYAASRLREELGDAAHTALAELSARVARTPQKEVYLFVHGYNNTFEDAVTTIAQIWHYLGRQGVPMAYTWPAGHGGLLRGYNYDRESSEFTVYHLKQVLRVIASCPDVQKVNLIAHSRGNDVLLSALRELHLEISGDGHGTTMTTRERLKLGTLILAAPDLDVEVVLQRMVTARLGRTPERMTMYISSTDKALGIASWLFGGDMRLGKLKASIFSPEELDQLRAAKTINIVDAQLKNIGNFGHDYFHSNPAVSSDLILVMRYHEPPGPEYGRPLGGSKEGFWVVDDKYPQRPPKTEALASDGKGK
jgi:esterase/lipase superfamily enzyme